MKNVGSIDRILRVSLGIAAVAAGLYYQSWWGLVGLVPLGTGFVSWCPLYAIFGMDTCPVKDAKIQ